MSSAKASGIDTGANGSAARNRDHNQGNQDRKYTTEQKAAVLKIRRCGQTAFYEILGLEKTCSDAEIKKAYRKQSLLTHPDKNGHEHADEAFKMVSRAFGVLSDKEKRDKFDQFGTDPDSRFESARAQNNPFAGFRGPRPGGGGPGGGFGGGGMFGDDEISPEEMFQRFFGGGFGGGGGPFGGFDTGPQFVFNLGGNRGFRVHQMGGNVPRRRPREGQNGRPAQPPATTRDTLMSLLPILFLFIFPLLTSLFSGGDSSPSTPSIVFDKAMGSQTHMRMTPKLHIKYFIDPVEVAGWTDYKLKQLDSQADVTFVRSMRKKCDMELRTKQSLHEQARGWFSQDPDKLRIAREYEMSSCKRLDTLGVSRG